MADIQSAAQLIGRLLVEEARYLYKVEDKVRELQDELEWMQCFLTVADASQYDNPMAQKWVVQIREFAYQGEDMIEKFLAGVVSNRTSRGDWLSMVKKFLRLLCAAREVHQIGYDIDILTGKISALSSRLRTYGIKFRTGESSSFWLSKLRKATYSSYKEVRLVGRDDDVEELVNRLVSDEAKGDQSRVIAICGEGGVGKTSVAKKVFHHERVRSKFEAFAWAYVSQPCQISSVQQDLLSSLTLKSSEQVAQMTDDEMKDELLKVQLKQRSFIVLDGVWDKEVWDVLKEAFPDASQGSASKLLLTTRHQEVAQHVDQNVHVRKIGRLDRTHSRSLLQEKVEGAPADISGGKDKTRLENMKEKMVQLCEGLPLAIVVLGGVLATKKMLKEWETVHENISSLLLDQADGPRWKRILEFSYYELPYQLKPCFLYLGYFPANLEISTRKITLLWEAEGLVSSVDDEMSEDTLQDVAESCLGELVERSLVQVGSRGLTVKAKTCLLHDLMRDICISKASKVNWLNIVQLGDPKQDQPSNTSPPSKSSSSSSSSSSYSKPPKSSTLAKRRFRRVAIYCGEALEKLPDGYRHATYIRSLLFFNTLKSKDVLVPLKKEALTRVFNDFRLLRVLDVENIFVQSLPNEVGHLIHLRYLSVKGSWISKLPSSIRHLRWLQTLDLRVLSFVRPRIPNVLWKLERLTHLYLPVNSFVLRYKANKLRLKGLNNLETLSNFSNICQEHDLGSLKNLRKFSSCDFFSHTGSVHILASLDSPLRHLEIISLRLNGQVFEDNSRILVESNHLRKLWVKGAVPESISSLKLPSKLIKLSIHNTRFVNDDPMQVLGKLSDLKVLSLEHNAYMGQAMTCFNGGFSELTHLTIKGQESWKLGQ